MSDDTKPCPITEVEPCRERPAIGTEVIFTREMKWNENIRGGRCVKVGTPARDIMVRKHGELEQRLDACREAHNARRRLDELAAERAEKAEKIPNGIVEAIQAQMDDGRIGPKAKRSLTPEEVARIEDRAKAAGVNPAIAEVCERVAANAPLREGDRVRVVGRALHSHLTGHVGVVRRVSENGVSVSFEHRHNELFLFRPVDLETVRQRVVVVLKGAPHHVGEKGRVSDDPKDHPDEDHLCVYLDAWPGAMHTYRKAHLAFIQEGQP